MEQEKTPDSAGDPLAELPIPPCPTVMLALIEETRKASVGYRRLSSLITRDASLSGAMINAANSSYFALRTPVTTAQQAMAVLGVTTICEIVTKLALRSTLGGAGGISMERFWERANYLGKCSSLLTERLSSVDRDAAYNFGLFHEAGIPVLMQKFPDYKEALLLANAAVDRPFTAIEQERHGTNHAAVGARLARVWKLPELICNAIHHHHDYGILRDQSVKDEELLDLVAIGVLAEHVVNVFLRRSPDAETRAALSTAQEHFQIDKDALHDLTDEVCHSLRELREGR